jgi:hypothetical protein
MQIVEQVTVYTVNAGNIQSLRKLTTYIKSTDFSRIRNLLSPALLRKKLAH